MQDTQVFMFYFVLNTFPAHGDSSEQFTKEQYFTCLANPLKPSNRFQYWLPSLILMCFKSTHSGYDET